MADDVWAASIAEEAALPAGEGLPANQAYSIDTVFRYGLAFLQEQPTLAAAGIGALFLTIVIPFLASFVFNIFGSVAGASGDDAGAMLQLLANFGQQMVTLIAMPFQILFTAGFINAVGHYVVTDLVEPKRVFTEIGAGVRVFVWRFAVGFAMTLVAAVFILPFVVIGGVIAFYAEAIIPGIATMFIGVIPYFVVGVYLSLRLLLGDEAAAIDGQWPIAAYTTTWNQTRGAFITLFVTSVVFGIVSAMAYASVFCLVGLVLFPAVLALTQAGFAVTYILNTRPESVTKNYAFFQRNPPPIF